MMNNLNSRGFTLVEILAVVVIIGVIGLIAVPSVLETINTGTQASYDVLVEDIAIASKQLYEEIDYFDNKLYHYRKSSGKTDNYVTIENNVITVRLQTLVSNGLLTGINNPDKSGDNKNNKIITNPKTKKDIGDCQIIITKVVDEKFNTSYQIKNNSTSSSCPTDDDYAKVMN